MKVLWFTLAFFTTHIIYAQEKSLTELLNFPIGGIWVSEKKQNDNQPESFSSFYMKFQNWSSEKSVTGDIYGVRNNGDTLQLIEVWNYTIPSAQHAILVREPRGEHIAPALLQFIKGSTSILFSKQPIQMVHHFGQEIFTISSPIMK
ncbi:hypothetical protein [Ekhidna sp.]|uniref:hypothetical protein n=1 Tax=Ekhidna sp. TaxID=2608089 RepID=UPI0035127C7F